MEWQGERHSGSDQFCHMPLRNLERWNLVPRKLKFSTDFEFFFTLQEKECQKLINRVLTLAWLHKSVPLAWNISLRGADPSQPVRGTSLVFLEGGMSFSFLGLMGTSFFYPRLCVTCTWPDPMLYVFSEWSYWGSFVCSSRGQGAPMLTTAAELALWCLCSKALCPPVPVWVLSFLAIPPSPNLIAEWHLVRAAPGGRYWYALSYFHRVGLVHWRCNWCHCLDRWKLFVTLKRMVKAEWWRQWPDWQEFQGELEGKCVEDSDVISRIM